ncbi:hypothetical protein PYW07_014087 [Mythimna separata]|uniref:Uncharacterized protein n=1 Tax=Mythimna separata TaxID=271217 RepID=A0AAD8DP72_MYTSE|nr:hypothetical protein PYW07_014087 [Mythimna separata]
MQTLLCVKSIPGQAVPHAEVLDELLSKYLGDSYSNSALFDFILGGNGTNTTNGDNLDISILDVDNVRKIINFAKQKHDEKLTQIANTRRQGDTRKYNRLYYWDEYVMNSSFNLMKQTVYMTREKVNLTRPWRKKYSHEFSYKIAILYGSSAAILGKMEGLLNQLNYFEYKTHFLWFLIIYEKILACNIEIADSIEKLFMVQGEFEEIRGAKPTLTSSKMNLTQAEIDAIKANPHLKDEIIAQKNITDKIQSLRTRVNP